MFTFLETHKLLRIIRNRKSEQTDNVYISPGLSKFLAISFMELYIQFLCQICEVLSYYFAKFNSSPSFSLLVDKLFLYPFFLPYLTALVGLLELKKKKKNLSSLFVSCVISKFLSSVSPILSLIWAFLFF